MRHHIALTWLLALTLPLSPGCGHDHEGHDHSHDHDHAHDHAHEARNGGTLVVLAEEFAHMEVLVDGDEVTAWSLGPHCETYVKLAQPTIDLTIAPDGVEPFTLTLAAQYSEASSDAEGSSSWFAATDARLAGLESFEGTFGAIDARGRAFESTSFPYPEGNDTRAHDHDHEH